MRVTTRTRYAIRALYHLAFHRAGEATQAKEIADAQKIPLRFLEQILQDLRRAGLVEARRGPRGGYALARPPAEISLADVLRAVRGPLEDLLGVGGVGETSGGRGRETAPADDIPTLVWGEVGGRLIDVLEHATLAEFVARAEAAGVRRAAAPATMYFI
jgi:Rrf2 family protein